MMNFSNCSDRRQIREVWSLRLTIKPFKSRDRIYLKVRRLWDRTSQLKEEHHNGSLQRTRFRIIRRIIITIATVLCHLRRRLLLQNLITHPQKKRIIGTVSNLNPTTKRLEICSTAWGNDRLWINQPARTSTIPWQLCLRFRWPETSRTQPWMFHRWTEN